jgi:hypothetical protein
MTFLTALLLLVAFPVALAYLTTRAGRRTHVPPDDKPTPQGTGKAKENDARITIGGRLIYTSFITAIASLFLAWADVSAFSKHATSRSGIELHMYVLLVIWFYPLLFTFRKAPFRLLWWVALSTVSLILPIVVWILIDHIQIYGAEVNPGFGVVVFVVASGTLIVGMLFHQVEHTIRHLRARES